MERYTALKKKGKDQKQQSSWKLNIRKTEQK